MNGVERSRLKKVPTNPWEVENGLDSVRGSFRAMKSTKNRDKSAGRLIFVFFGSGFAMNVPFQVVSHITLMGS